MSVIKNQYEQLRAHLDRLSDKQKIGFSLVTVLAIAGIIGIGWWSSRPHYVPMADGLSITVAGEVKAKLDAAGIANRLSFSGTGVLVPTNKVSEARVLAGELLGESGSSGGFSGGFLPLPGDDGDNRLRQLEAAIEQTLIKMTQIDSAEVHIAKPDPTPFLSERADPTASVILGIRRGTQFGPQQAMTIVQLVAGSVDGLTTDNVTVSDLKGQRWSGKAGGVSALSENDAYRTKLQNDIAMNAQEVLSTYLGLGKAIVRVSADIDFTQVQRTAELFDAANKVVKTEKIENSTTAATGGGGAAGAAGNLAPGGGGGGGGAAGGKTEIIDSTFETPKTTEKTIIPAGKLKRMTITAVVDIPQPDPNNPNAPPPPTQQQIEEAIKNAVGFDQKRNDQITVLLQPLAGTTIADVVAPPSALWENLALIAKNGSLGIAAIVAMLLGFMFLKKIQPVLEAPSAAAMSSAQERSRVMSELSEQAKANPEVISKILAAWLESSKGAQPDLKVYNEKKAA